MRLPWSRDYSKGAAYATTEYLCLMFQGQFGVAPRPIEKEVLVLDFEELKALASRYVDATWMRYGARSALDAEPWPKCDDFCWSAYGHFIEGAYKAGLTIQPAVGFIEFLEQSGGCHQMLFAYVVISGQFRIVLYEPQTGEWSTELSRVKTVQLAEF